MRDHVARSLKVALAQYPPITGADPVAELHAQATAICEGGPAVTMIVFPEMHLCGNADISGDGAPKLGITAG